MSAWVGLADLIIVAVFITVPVCLIGLLIVEVLEWRQGRGDDQRCMCGRYSMITGPLRESDTGMLHGHGRCQPDGYETI
jgi:hypothetical protein